MRFIVAVFLSLALFAVVSHALPEASSDIVVKEGEIIHIDAGDVSKLNVDVAEGADGCRRICVNHKCYIKCF